MGGIEFFSFHTYIESLYCDMDMPPEIIPNGSQILMKEQKCIPSTMISQALFAVC